MNENKVMNEIQYILSEMIELIESISPLYPGDSTLYDSKVEHIKSRIDTLLQE